MIQILQEENQKLQEINYRLHQNNMFEISNSQFQNVQQWKNIHECKHRGKSHGAIGGQYTYRFTPTSIGVFCEVQCSCGEKLDISEV